MSIINPILFRQGDSVWTLGGLMVALGIGLMLLFLALMPFVLRAIKVPKRIMTGAEAALGAMAAADFNDTKVDLIAHGPAIGVEWRFGCSIGDLRRAWHERRYGYFYGLPLYFSLWTTGAGVVLVGSTLIYHTWMFVLAGGIPVMSMQLAAVFMMWAAVYTKLE
jgi:hypothetical protein